MACKKGWNLPTYLYIYIYICLVMTVHWKYCGRTCLKKPVTAASRSPWPYYMIILFPFGNTVCIKYKHHNWEWNAVEGWISPRTKHNKNYIKHNVLQSHQVVKKLTKQNAKHFINRKDEVHTVVLRLMWIKQGNIKTEIRHQQTCVKYWDYSPKVRPATRFEIAAPISFGLLQCCTIHA
jgi:hypothetical protein